MADHRDEQGRYMLAQVVDGADQSYQAQPGSSVVYLAGGCFWGLEHLLQAMPGVLSAVSGYANGNIENPSYEEVCAGDTGFRETVRAEYDPDKISLDALLFAYFAAIDLEAIDRQGNDIGSQYQSGVYYADAATGETAVRLANVELLRYPNMAVEVLPLRNYYPAEEYHQDYLDKNPLGYCHISPDEVSRLSNVIVDPGRYPRPEQEQIAAQLSEAQYQVTQNAGTEYAFSHQYWDYFEPGIYVDIVTGEPLFSSRDKFSSLCGWPSFSAPIDENALIYLADDSANMQRIEVRSRAGNSHLGHVFYGEANVPEGVRFCINGEALRFIPAAELEQQGYGYLSEYL